MIDADKILAVAPASKPYLPALLTQMRTAQIDVSPHRVAMFLGQIHVESGGFKQVVENLNYSTAALLKMFGSHRITPDQAQRYGRNSAHPADQRALANILYGDEFGRKQLGNTEVGDGWRFRGRGLKQITGRANYLAFSRAAFGDDSAVDRPELVEQPNGAVASAVWFWVAKGLNRASDTGDVRAVTKIVNGGVNGLTERKKWYGVYLRALQS